MNKVRDAGAGRYGWPLYRGDLLDINVWVALSLNTHPHHEAAARYWRETLAQYNQRNATQPNEPAAQLHFCRHTALSLVRVLLQATAVLGEPLSLRDAWATYQSYRAFAEVGFAGETRDGRELDNISQDLMGASEPWAPRVWMDMHLAATAQMHGLRLVTFDRDFKRFDLPDLLVLEL